jgi:hypothetical protein
MDYKKAFEKQREIINLLDIWKYPMSPSAWNELNSLRDELAVLEQEQSENEERIAPVRDKELEDILIDFANWYLRLIKVTSDKNERFEIENREIIWSFLRGDDYKLWWEKVGEQGQPERKSVEEINLKPNHKCRLVAKACMGQGREWWCGELIESIKEYPLETHCLHLKTQLKDVVFLCNKADFQQLQLLGRSITGKLNERWVIAMLKVVNPLHSEVDQSQPQVELTDETIRDYAEKRFPSLNSNEAEIYEKGMKFARDYMKGIIKGNVMKNK